MFYDQGEFDVRCEWGEQGIAVLAPISDVVVIVDVLSFSTCVEMATSRGAVVWPYRWRDESARVFAQDHGALLAGRRGEPGAFSLSPASVKSIATGMRLVLPSPNGSTLSLGAGSRPTLCGCVRNGRAVAEWAGRLGRRIAVIAAGERWEDGSVRFAVEDWIGAGAIMRHLSGRRSPEAQAAVAAFESAAADLPSYLRQCASGRELLERGWECDVLLAAECDVSDCVPLLKDGAYLNQSADR